MNNKTKIAIAAVAFAFVGIIILLFAGGSKLSKSDTNVEALLKQGKVDISRMDADLLHDLFSYRLVPGKSYSYSFRRGLQIFMAKKEIVNMEFLGILTAHVVRARGDRIDLVVELLFHSVRGVEKDSELLRGKSEKERTHTMHLVMNRRGDVIDSRYPAAIKDDEQILVLGDIVARWLTTMPGRASLAAALKKKADSSNRLTRLVSGQGVGPVEVASKDSMGDYVALFAGEQAEKSIRINKVKQRYTRSSAAVRIIRSDNKHDFDFVGGFFRSMKGSEHFGHGEQSIKAESILSYQFDFTGTGKSTYSDADLSLYSSSIAFFEPNRKGAMRSMAGVPIKPWKEIRVMLSELKTTDSRKAKNAVFNTLASSLKANPTMTTAVLSATRDYPSDSEQHKMIMGALTYSGTPAVQKGLIEMFRSNQIDAAGRMAAIQAMTMLSQPFTGEANQFLSQAFDDSRYGDFRDNVGLAMGSALRNPGGTKSQRQKIREQLMNEWERASGPARKARVLEMLGNTGDAYFLDVFKGVYENESNLQLRALAVYCMRFVDTEEAGRLVLAALNETTPQIRSAAVEALARHTFRKMYYQPLAGIIRDSRNAEIRLKSSEVLLGQPDREIQAKALALLDDVKGSASPGFRSYINQVIRASGG